MQRPKILISNDDGINADGIAALATAMRKIGPVCVCAPQRDHSGASSSISLGKIRVKKIRDGEFSVAGTPADSVHLALMAAGILPWKPDLTVTGINCGANLGEDTIYSGTVAAAIESALTGIPAVAFSLVPAAGAFPPTHFDDAALVAGELVGKLLATDRCPADLLLSVNIPDLPRARMGSFVATRLGSRGASRLPFCREKELDGSSGVYSYTMHDGELAGEPGDDFHALARSQIAVTPLTCDLTDSGPGQEFVSTWLR
ncbi:MAG: 5'/3'-nucleotidase SurE [Betaproteobacteria bacterium]|nr:5'/3'-nucleotidase SurE [Betaproteobacteria bacterium]